MSISWVFFRPHGPPGLQMLQNQLPEYISWAYFRPHCPPPPPPPPWTPDFAKPTASMIAAFEQQLGIFPATWPQTPDVAKPTAPVTARI